MSLIAMLSFRENFFFVKFSVLFFLILIFGYWGIDLNSEELYIAFSFLFLVVLAFVMSRKALLFVFVKAVNLKFSRIVSDLFVIVGAITLQLSGLYTLQNYFKILSQDILKFCVLSVDLLGLSARTFLAAVTARTCAINIYLTLGVNAFFKIIARNRRVSSVIGEFSRFFNISI